MNSLPLQTLNLDPEHSVATAAAQVLDIRFRTLWHWLALAGGEADADVEAVHQLRVTTRRTGVALAVFARLWPASLVDSWRTRLRGIRRSADAVRDWDMLAARWTALANDPLGKRVQHDLQQRRRAAQVAIGDVEHEAVYARWRTAASEFTQEIRRGKKVAQQSLARFAPAVAARYTRKFLHAATGPLDDTARVHRLRIRAKKLRYALELLAPALPSKDVARSLHDLEAWQEKLGAAHDAQVAARLARAWREAITPAALKAFLAGAALVEAQAAEALHRAVVAELTPAWRKTMKRTWRKWLDF